MGNKVNYYATNFIIHERIILLSRAFLNGISVLSVISSVSVISIILHAMKSHCKKKLVAVVILINNILKCIL